MDKNKILDILKDTENKSNKDLVQAMDVLKNEFNKTKDLIIDLTRHLETIEDLYNKAYNEYIKRTNNQ